MKRVVFFLAVTVLTTMNTFSQKKETREVANFTGIEASSVFDITVVKGNSESLIIEADDNVMPYVRSEVRNGVLHLYLDKNKLKNIKTLKASIVMRNLDNVILSGACKLTVNDMFSSEKFIVKCSGVSNLTINVNTGNLNLESSGACKIQIKANVTGDADLSVSGTSKLQSELKANNVILNSSGTGTIDLNGSARNLNINTSGTANIKAENFTVKTATINSSGASKTNVNVADILVVNASGTSSVNYKGTPSITFNSAGVAKIRNL